MDSALEVRQHEVQAPPIGLGVLMLSILIMASPYASGETLRNTERTVNVKYSDGFVEKYIVAYNGVVNVAKEERGSARFPDNRQCFWSIQTYVGRQIYSVNRQGQRAVLEQFNRKFETAFANQGDDFKILKLRPENCNDANNRFESDVNNAKQAIQQKFEPIVTEDLKTLKNVLTRQLR
jgi:hypothetical protein